MDKLRRASYEYHNGLKQSMTDQEYDELYEKMKKLDPFNSFFEEVGARAIDEVDLPYKMPSLDKKNNENIDKWISKYSANEYVIEPKIDGCSALYIIRYDKNDSCFHKKLYTRGNGIKGRDISHLIPYLKCLDETYHFFVDTDDMVVRGELVLPNLSQFISEGQIARNLVAGAINKKTIDEKLLSEMHFYAYEFIYKNISQINSFDVLEECGFRAIPHILISSNEFTNGAKETLNEIYDLFVRELSCDIDGLVVTPNIDRSHDVEIRTSGPVPPKDRIAWKDFKNVQTYTTEVTRVEWNPSSYGIFVPRVFYKPVKVVGAVLSRSTGINAKWIVDNKIGPGAIISVIRSGDTIPKIVKVIKSAEEPQMPDDEYEWVDNGDRELINIKTLSKELYTIQRLKKGLDELDVENVGIGIVKNMYNAGFDTIEKIYAASESDFEEKLERCGEKLAKRIYAGLRVNKNKWNELNFMLASCTMPRGIGMTKLKLLYDIEKNPEKWSTELFESKKIKGISIETISDIVACVDDYIEWYNDNMSSNEIFSIIDDSNNNEKSFSDISPEVSRKPMFKSEVLSQSPYDTDCMDIPNQCQRSLTYVFTGFRDNALKEKLEKSGHSVVENVTKAVDFVVYKGTLTESGKTKKAQQYGIKLIEYNDV